MRVTPAVDRLDANRSIAYVNGLVCFFQEGSPQPRAGTKVDVMIVGAIRHRVGTDPNKHIFARDKHPRHLILRVIGENDIPVTYDGFVMEAPLLKTCSVAHRQDNGDPLVIEPQMQDVAFAKHLFRSAPMPALKAGEGWIQFEADENNRPVPKLVGVEDPSMLRGWQQ